MEEVSKLDEIFDRLFSGLGDDPISEEEAKQQIIALIDELIGENPPESEWWRYSGELWGHIQLRNELRKRKQELFG